MQLRIECLKFKSCQKGALVGFADLRVIDWGLDIYGVSRYMKNGKAWISFPSKEYLTSTNEKKYLSHMRFTTMEQMEEFSKLAIKAIDEFCMAESKKQDFPPIDEECPF